MPSVVSEGPSVSMSFANNFWGKDDAGVDPLMQRMHNAKQTCDELKSFYTARSALEDEYARKLLSLARKPLGSQEAGTLRSSMDVLRGEVEQMGKSHQNIASQMKTELEEPLAAFAGAMKERRKIVQGGIEKVLKVKIQQTQLVNKTRDRYEQECLKIKGYLAQGHMVMGQEERKNKAKLEKTQINLATSNTEYENAVKALEETTGRWNRDWKAAADKFQDLEEERLDFMKSSLWSFANIASTVCVSDDASCEKVRLSLENCEVEKDIASFIKERGTGQEIPDPPKYINFCRGDVSDTQSEASEDDNYSVAQFPRTINPAYRSSSPQPSVFESHNDPQSVLAKDLLAHEPESLSREATLTPQKASVDRSRQAHVEDYHPPPARAVQNEYQQKQPRQLEQQPQARQASRQQLEYQPQPRQQQQEPQQNSLTYEQSQHGPISAVPHDPYPMDGMTMLCRTGPPSELSSAHSGARPSSRDSNSEYSNPTSFSSRDPVSGKTSPVKQVGAPVEKQVMKKKSGFFQSHSPFRRKSNKDKDHAAITPSSRNTWSARTTTSGQSSPTKRPQVYGHGSQNMISDRPSGSPEPIDPRASFQLNVGNNVFDVATPERKGKMAQTKAPPEEEDLDPIAQALAELKGVTKASSTRISADKFHGIPTPAPGTTPSSRPIGSQMVNGALMAGMRGTPPPSYDQPVQRLGLPQPAFTSRAMQQTRQKYVDQTQTMFSAQSRPDSQGGYGGSQSQSRPGTRGSDMPRATSPAPPRSVSPRPVIQPDARQSYRSASPNPYAGSQRNRAQSTTPQKRGSDQGYYRHNSPNDAARAASPAPFRNEERPSSSHMNSDISMQMQLAPAPEDGYGSQRGGRSGGSASSRTMSYYGGSQSGSQGGQQLASRQRSKSVADVRQYNREGRPILHFARAMYMYQAAIPEELSFGKGDVLAVLRLQDDGWWEAEIAGKNGRPGLVPSNYLQNC
ncbi:probable proline-serine-threonine phosphatase-interacting protein 2 [Rhynchosporium secalis]|uniref:Probable proline-serine-threonine phosphatase-interacting protein 2 n=1 Tax=Rhynchosporium secalis TaxID=38038 RepID=A0A1E1M1U7_RHYSE|nr:probable proline-serine-threonine phosphatase-interacting protein 2 [Rhynchosporium secalis]